MDNNQDRQQTERTSKQTQSNTDSRPQSSDNAVNNTNDNKGTAKKAAKVTGLVLLILILIAAAGFGSYWWRGNLAENREAELEDNINNLETEVERLENEDASDSEESEKEESLANVIETAFSEEDYSQLEPHMSESVSVVRAGTDGQGPKSPSEAVENIEEYLADTNEWEFDLPQSELVDYRNGPYAQYFPAGVHAGNSEEDYVVAFSFNDSGAIAGVFMAVNEDLLTD